ncbi:CST complex subunit STN1-like isoform X1 [Asterias rubens]|uniref:CST complex subunit STN1-like isoform X1 n=2 Tax=Asterias rubens TaxID=7604 RepID=UPI0014556002|nr:CST complex subunit STN1-like isoform X1 [Asterias rubens]
MAAGENLDFVPHRFWHTDSVYKSHVKLYIVDIVSLLDYPMGKGAFAYKNHPVYRVDILGWIVRVEERAKMFNYGVDDGTGVVNCCCWKPKGRDKPAAVNPDSSFREFVTDKIQTHQMQQLTCMELGDIIHVRGRLNRYRNRVEVSASYFRKVEDQSCKAEIYRMEELPNMYQNVYDRPFVLPSIVTSQLRLESEESESGVQREADLVDRLCIYLRSQLGDPSNGFQNFFLRELETIEAVMDIASCPCLEYKQDSVGGKAPIRQIRNIIKQSVDRLDREGIVIRSGNEKEMFQVAQESLTSWLEKTILKILRADCQLPKYEKGCHYLHVMDRLHNLNPFQNISAQAVKLALDRLEEQSEVISTTFKHFIPFS